MSNANRPDRPASGVVAVIFRDQRFLVIRRSNKVRAPGAFCFPGGSVEPGETDRQALRRELQEELSISGRIGRLLWNTTTPSGMPLAWYATELSPEAVPVANPDEVASIHWFTQEQMVALNSLLPTNQRFLAAIACGDIEWGIDRP